MRPGIFAKTFAGDSLEDCLDRVADNGIKSIQFNLALVGGPSLPSEVSPSLASQIQESVKARGLEMVALSGTCNLVDPDPRRRRTTLDALCTAIAAAPTLGTGLVTLCTGSRDPSDMWRWHPDNSTPEAWADLLASLAVALEVAEQHGVCLAFEPEHGNVASDASAARRLLDEVGAPHLKVVIDAANLIPVDGLDRQAETLAAAFDLLAGDIALAHAKDLAQDGSVVPAGCGALDYPYYVDLLRQANYEGALVLHSLAPGDVPRSVGFLREVLGLPLPDPA